MEARTRPEETGEKITNTAMNRPQRIVIIAYCLLVACSCVWVPWHATQIVTDEHGQRTENARLGYAWVWSRVGPMWLVEREDKLDTPSEREVAYGLWRERWSARPDITVIALCLLAATSLGAGTFVLVGGWGSF